MARRKQGEKTQFLELFEPILYAFFLKRFDEKEATELTIALIEQLSKDVSGLIFYVPKNLFLGMTKKKNLILKDYPQHKIADIARKYNVSAQYVYRVIKQLS